MDPRQQIDAEGEQFLLNMIAEGGGAQGDAPERANDGSNTDIYLNMSGEKLRHHPFRMSLLQSKMTLLVNKVLMYISQLYLLILKIIFSSESI